MSSISTTEPRDRFFYFMFGLLIQALYLLVFSFIILIISGVSGRHMTEYVSVIASGSSILAGISWLLLLCLRGMTRDESAAELGLARNYSALGLGLAVGVTALAAFLLS